MNKKMDFGSKIQIARDTYRELLESQKPFGFLELKKEIVEREGILRHSVGVTIGEKMESDLEKGILSYNPQIAKYCYTGKSR